MLKQGLNNILYKMVGEYTSAAEDIDNCCEDMEYSVESVLPSEAAVEELLKVVEQVRSEK